MNLPKTQKGFTLIELMIVIAILAVLAAIGFAIFSNLGAQAKARNITRRADLDSIAKALEVNKDKVTVGNYALLADTQFTNAKIPLLDPQGYEYCANTTASPTAGNPVSPTASWTSGASGCAAATVVGEWSPVSTTKPPAGTSWKICTWLEQEANPAKAATVFCKISAQ